MIGKKSQHNVPGKLITPRELFTEKLKRIKALVFDWDGIFNDSSKGSGISQFNEVDSMGVNMLRFGYYLIHSQNPFTAIVTGERNETAINWAEREHFHFVHMKVKNKVDVLERITEEGSVEPGEIMFIFDDIHDLSLARECGVKILVNNFGSRLFREFCRKNKLCDYITANRGGNQALREISETVLSQLGIFEKTVKARIDFHGIYYDYYQIRNLASTNTSELDY